MIFMGLYNLAPLLFPVAKAGSFSKNAKGHFFFFLKYNNCFRT
jgi:hypothetical protein